MDELEGYLQAELPVEQEDLLELNNLICETGTTLITTFNPNTGWPHRVGRDQKSSELSLPSHFATALVTVTLWKLLGRWNRPQWRGIVPEFPALVSSSLDLKQVRKIAVQGTELLLKSISTGSAVKTHSATYGDDDPFTLSYLAELTCIAETEDIAGFDRKAVDAHLRQRANVLNKALRGDALRDQERLYHKRNTGTRAISNAMIALRVLHTLRTCNELVPANAMRFREYFHDTFHEQVSYFSIPDSRFDPAELAFALEGLLISQEPHAIDRGMLERGVTVLKDAQLQSAFWRPVKPFLATDKGMALFPVSVEVANSVARSAEIFDQTRLRNTLDTLTVPLLRRYLKWTQARLVRFQSGKVNIVGWHSEHVNDLGAIHIWETSLVLEFLLAYRHALQSRIARQLLISSNLGVRNPAPAARRNDSSQAEPKEQQKPWETLDHEPVRAFGGRYRVFERIEAHFIRDWKNKKPERFSMLLYGPPGTGKTTVARAIADALDYRLITVSVGDFLAIGNAQLEQRARAIFNVLMMQPRCVVLFDEIDNFLLHRESTRYSKQETPYQFTTPGMLTKLADLWAAKRVIFIIATNYEYRIDPAIKRTGRIDNQYLLLPPDAAGRAKIIRDELASKLTKAELADVNKPDRMRELQKASALLGKGDIAAAALSALRREDQSTSFHGHLVSELRQRRRSTSIGSYLNQHGNPDDIDFPHEELACLIGLVAEADADFLASDKDALNTFLARLGPGMRLEDWLDTHAPGLDRAIVVRIIKWIENAKS